MGKRFPIFLVFLLVLSLFLQSGVLADTNAPAIEEEKPTSFRFDFGSVTSPVEDGYLKVANTDIYNKEKGFGFNKEVGFRDRGEPDSLHRDFVLADGAEFLVDLPDGDYFIRIIAGDQIAFNRSSFTIEGKDQGSITSQTGQFSVLTANATVSDGQLNIQIGENGRMNGLEITPIADVPTLEIGEVSLAPDIFVKLTWNEEDTAKSYKIYRKQGDKEEFKLIDESSKEEYIDKNVELGASYTYAVSLVNNEGIESEKSNEVFVDMLDQSITAPPAPTGLELKSATEDSITFNWQPVEGALEYHVYRSRFNQKDYPNYEINYTKVGTTKKTSFKDESIFTTAPYYYVVMAVNGGGTSEKSKALETPIKKKQLKQMEDLNRAVVAVDTEKGIYVGWKMLGTDPKSVTFDLYRDGEKVNKKPIAASTNYLDEEGTIDSKYQVRVNGGSSETITEEVGVWSEQYLSIPLDKPEGGTTPDGVDYTYSANDASVGDVTGDGNYEVILKWDPSNSKDNSQSGYTGNVYIDAYTLEGERLWRIDLGKNIRAGAHYTQFLVYDFDGNGQAEVVMKTADGTVDGAGNVIGDPDADYRNSNGYVLEGPEYLSVFNGETGEVMETTDYEPPRGKVGDWGDNYGNRVDRFLAGVAYLDGERPSFVMARGYYTRTVLAAYNWRDGKLTQEWVFDTNEPGNEAYAGQGNHSLAVADVDGDGKDEIVYGAAVIDHDGTGLYSTGLGHGDANHVTDLNPNRPGLEIFEVYENKGSAYGFAIRDAETGEILSGKQTGSDVGRGMAADIDPRYEGAEYWASSSWDGSSGKSGLFSVEGELITNNTPSSMNFAIWWDGDLLRELLDHDFNPDVDPHGVGKIEKWNWEEEKLEKIFVPEGTRTNNWTKGNPTLQADLFGDWREEVIWPSADSTELRIYTTTDLTEHKLFTLMHDPQYRTAVAWQNVAYNQPPHPSFYIGHDMKEPAMPNIRVVKIDEDEPEEITTESLLSTLEDYQGDMAEKDYRALSIHLTSVGQFEKKKNTAKVVKHLENFQKLLDHQLEGKAIPQKLYDTLKEDTKELIVKWKKA